MIRAFALVGGLGIRAHRCGDTVEFLNERYRTTKRD
jgi:hypothetical protein